ncbi:MAG: helix-turn-helix domain-containing protein [Pseudomonadota bacterium]
MFIGRELDAAHARLAVSLVAYGLSQSSNAILKEGRGTADAAFARQIAMYVLYVGMGLSLSRVAAAFGRDRTTVSHACHQIENRRENPIFDDWLESLEASLVHAAKLYPTKWSAA